MLLVLVCLAALGPLAAAAVNFEVKVDSCSVSYYGQVYAKVYVNLESNTSAVCFKGPYPATAKNNCIVFTGITAANGQSTVTVSSTDPGSSFHSNVTGLTGSSTCEFRIKFRNSTNTDLFALTFRQFGNQSVLYTETFQSVLLTGDMTVDGVSMQTFSASGITYRDTTACRRSGFMHRVNLVVCDRDGVSTSCSVQGNIIVSPCGTFCTCPGNFTCTVAGSSVINFYNNVTHVRDRCAYTLLSQSGTKLLAVFRDRRRKDISLLDRVILRLDGPNVSITLGPGGMVQVDNSPMSLNSSPQSLHGVVFSKNQTGVTARFLLSKDNASVFFDGSTAQIHMTVSLDPRHPGLCIRPSGASLDRSSGFSSSSCQQQFNESSDKTINCTTVTERCSVLRKAPFASCNNHTDPEPFISACSHNLCKYPSVDGVSHCQFLEAYVQACDFQTSNSLEGWRSEAGCSPPRVSCQNVLCSDHEFCAEDITGVTSCACRAIFSSKYRSTGAFGEPTVCDGNSASVTLVGCLLGEKGIDYSELHLNNRSCRGQMDNVTNMVTFGFNSSDACGTVVELNNSQIFYNNSIMASNSSGIITRHDQFIINFSCFYQQPIAKTVGFKIKDSSVILQIVSGPWNYTLTMKAYSDAGRTQAIGPKLEILLQQRVWVELKTDGLDDKLVAVVTDSCWATNQPLDNSSLRYDLIVGGCPNPADQTVTQEANGLGTSNYFSFNMFQFSGKSGDVYLHCKLNLCVKKGKTCAPSCTGKRRRRSARSKYEDGSSAFITMAWTN